MRGMHFGSRLRAFESNEKGSMTILAVTLLMAAALLGGLAVDVMRFENRRTQMQNALDLCVLNAASLRQTLDEKTVFRDCVVKAGMTGTITNLTVTKGTSSKTVSASATETLPTMFIGLLGMNTLTVQATSSAAERVGNVEIALVLDLSGSMAGSRITNLKIAAKEFVRTLLEEDVNNRILITVVPYNGSVNLGNQLAAKYNLTNVPHNTTNSPDLRNIRCVDLPDAAFAGTAISRTTAMPAASFVDPVTFYGEVNAFLSPTSRGAAPVMDYNYCKTTPSAYAGNVVQLPGFTPPGEQDKVATPGKRIEYLSTFIDSLTPAGATSIHKGMRWGLAFLDPSMNSIYREFIASGQMPSALSNRPLAFGDPDVMKVIVLMSDGENTTDEFINPGYRSGSASPSAPASQRSPMSTIWLGTDGNYSMFHSGRPQDADHYVPHLGTWRATPWVNATDTGTATNLTWGQVWDRFPLGYVAWQFYSRAGISTVANTRPIFRSTIPPATMNSQLQTVCNTARNSNVLVYSISFEATVSGQTELRNCATTLSRYYVATPTTISQVFSSIAGNITKLRLTQ